MHSVFRVHSYTNPHPRLFHLSSRLIPGINALDIVATLMGLYIDIVIHSKLCGAVEATFAPVADVEAIFRTSLDFVLLIVTYERCENDVVRFQGRCYIVVFFRFTLFRFVLSPVLKLHLSPPSVLNVNRIAASAWPTILHFSLLSMNCLFCYFILFQISLGVLPHGPLHRQKSVENEEDGCCLRLGFCNRCGRLAHSFVSYREFGFLTTQEICYRL